MNPADISVIIPTLNEQDTITESVGSALAAGAEEVIISDGGSTDATWDLAQQAGASIRVRSLPGRGIQLNAGAVHAQRDVLLFLHADNRLHRTCLQQICQCGEPLWGAFRQRIESNRTVFRLLEWGNSLRARYRAMPFGDQGIFVQRETYQRVGGFPEIPLMEDVELSGKLREFRRPLLLDGPLYVSPRRWDRRGVIRQTLINWSIQMSYRLGASPEQLQQRYR